MDRLLDTRAICLRYSTFVHLGCCGSYRLEVGRNYEEFADTRGVIGNRKSKKDRQDNAQKKKKDTWTRNDLQKTTQKIKDCQKQMHPFES